MSEDVTVEFNEIYSEWQAQLDVVINYETISVGNFYELDGQSIDGVKISILEDPDHPNDPEYYRIQLIGPLINFEIGGYYLWIDQWCLVYQ